jgi:predicted ATPase
MEGNIFKYMKNQFLNEILINIKDENRESYPYNLKILNNISTISFHDKITFFVGENGSGKSTILEALVVCLGLNPEGGSKNFNFKTVDTHSELARNIKLVKGIKPIKNSYFVRAETFYNLSSNIDELGLGHYYSDNLSIHKLSHGEAFISLFENRFWSEGLYLLDEPEAALSPTRQLALLKILSDLIKDGSQFIIATHSPILMAFPDSKIYSFDNENIQNIKYENTEHYNITKYFMNNYKLMIKDLLK